MTGAAASLPDPVLHDVSDDERAAACALSALAGVGKGAFALLRAQYGSLAAAVQRPPAELAAIAGMRQDAAASLGLATGLPERGQWLLRQAASLGARVRLLGEPDFPEQLARSGQSAPLLYILGEWREARRVAIVGSRKSDGYGLDAARRIAERLLADGFDVVSGGAQGVDAAAHEAVLEAGGRTIAVVGTGLLKPYPAEHRSLFQRIARQGAVVSEFAMDAGGNQKHFPRRNRTIAGLSEAVVVTRGDAGSGSHSTCLSALAMNRPVFAYPGDARQAQSTMPNAWLAAGAYGVLDGSEIRRVLDGPVERRVVTKPVLARPEKSSPAAREVVSPASLSKDGRVVFEALGPEPVHVDALAEGIGRPVSETLTALLELELGGLCVQRPGKYFQRR